MKWTANRANALTMHIMLSTQQCPTSNIDSRTHLYIQLFILLFQLPYVGITAGNLTLRTYVV